MSGKRVCGFEGSFMNGLLDRSLDRSLLYMVATASMR